MANVRLVDVTADASPRDGAPAEADSAAAGRLAGDPDRVLIRTLGGFLVYRGSVPCPVPPGLPSQAIKFVVAKGGRVHSEVLIDELWPQAHLDEGRKGVRNVLNRLGRSVPLLVRDGALIRIAGDVVVDSVAFRHAADRVLLNAGAPGAVQAARSALARYAGPFLPDDMYCEWAAGIRDQLQRRHLALLDLVASDARRRGAALEAVHLLEMAIEVDPVDEIRYLEAAEILLRAGRRGRAAALLERSRTALEEYGLSVGPGWQRLVRSLQDGVIPEPGTAFTGRRPARGPASPERTSGAEQRATRGEWAGARDERRPGPASPERTSGAESAVRPRADTRETGPSYGLQQPPSRDPRVTRGSAPAQEKWRPQ